MKKKASKDCEFNLLQRAFFLKLDMIEGLSCMLYLWQFEEQCYIQQDQKQQTVERREQKPGFVIISFAML